MIKYDITTFNKVTTSPAWDNVPLKPSQTTGSDTAANVKTAIDTVLDNLGLMQSGEKIMIQIEVE